MLGRETIKCCGILVPETSKVLSLLSIPSCLITWKYSHRAVYELSHLKNISVLNEWMYVYWHPSTKFTPAMDIVTGNARGCAREQACLKLDSMWTRKQVSSQAKVYIGYWVSDKRYIAVLWRGKILSTALVLSASDGHQYEHISVFIIYPPDNGRKEGWKCFI